MSMRSLTVKVGQTIVIDAPFVAEPEPTVTWSYEGNELKADDRVSMTVGPKGAKLTILNAKRSETGKYTLKASNDSGSDTATCDVVVLAAPTKPKGPIEARDVKKLDC